MRAIKSMATSIKLQEERLNQIRVSFQMSSRCGELPLSLMNPSPAA